MDATHNALPRSPWARAKYLRTLAGLPAAEGAEGEDGGTQDLDAVLRGIQAEQSGKNAGAPSSGRAGRA